MKRLIGVVALVLVGCAGQHLTTDYNSVLDPEISAKLREGVEEVTIPERAVLGGEIAAVTYQDGDTRIELNRLQLTERAYPLIRNEVPYEKVIVTIQGVRLQGERFKVGNYLSAVGTIESVEKSQIGGINYTITTLIAERYQTWLSNERRLRPLYDDRRLHGGFYGGSGSRYGFGIGIGF